MVDELLHNSKTVFRIASVFEYINGCSNFVNISTSSLGVNSGGSSGSGGSGKSSSSGGGVGNGNGGCGCSDICSIYCSFYYSSDSFVAMVTAAYRQNVNTSLPSAGQY